MTDQEVIERGIRAEHMLRDDVFVNVTQDLVKVLSDAILTTKPEDKEGRERIYYMYQGLNDLVGLLNSFVATRLEVEARLKAEENN